MPKKGLLLKAMNTTRLPIKRGRVILVEDDREVRDSLTMLLRAWGFSVEVFQTGTQMLMNRYLPDGDCLLIDYKMPYLNGIELLTRLRRAGSDVPALLITGVFSNTLMEKALAAGFSDVLEKPGLDRVLASRILALMGPAA